MDGVYTMFTKPGQLLALGEYLLAMHEARRCKYEQPSTTDIRDGIQQIAYSLLQGVQKEDPRFEGELMGTGSFYDGLKVGEVDEFDFMLQLNALSKKGDLHFLKSEPGFANIVLLDNSARWPTTPYCLQHNTKASEKSKCRTRCTDLIDILDAYIVQEMFRELTDKVLSAMSLPKNWEHGGFNRPAFGGFRRHGPATLYQFVFKAPHRNEEVKVNMDLTLSIKIPTPTDRKPFQFDFSLYPKLNHEVDYFNSLIDYYPGLSIIPLYSNFMIATGKADKRYSWKVSCSRAERTFLESYQKSSLLKTAIRVLKIIRDDHLTYYKRQSRVPQKQCKPNQQKANNNDNIEQLLSDLERLDIASPTANISKEILGRNNITGANPDVSPVLPRGAHLGIGARPKALSTYNVLSELTGNNNVLEQATHRDVAPVGIHGDDASTSTFPLAFAPDDEEGSDAGESDVTEVVERTPTEYRARYELELPKYQSYDIGQERVTPQPGSGEYYGPRQYIASVEIKFVLLDRVLRESENTLKFKEEVSPERLALFVLYGLDRFRRIYESPKETLCSLYFKSPVRSPLSATKRQEIRASIAKILRNLRQESLKNL